MSKKLSDRDLGPAPIDDPMRGTDYHQPEAPKPRERLEPKLGLEGMTWFLMDIVLRGKMRDGSFAGETIKVLTPSDLEKLTDIADTLEYFRLQRQQARLEEQRRSRR
ncbi:hypothetical protein CFBP5507_06190 [Agrobacterium salinitolerans]|uniref:Uncharacterized protein n=1 Tax=Agrobacterium salinitolerans TaxID=1183413 RepID=A0A4Z1RA72_9HYPH|nr:hypothetical protein [Agrobacterium salinitolerans]UYZ08589.1 hypothetical protein CFBP5507_06190 [Agrobacterium salinitolerans]